MRRALIVAYYFPPVVTSGAMRPLGFCRHLEEFGWVPRVLTTEPTSIQPLLATDDRLCAKLPTKVRVDRVAHRNRLTSLIRAKHSMREALAGLGTSRKGSSNGGPGASGARTNGNHGVFFALKESTLEWLFAFPDPQCDWWRPAVRHATTLPWEKRPDVVLATGGPWTALLAGHSIAQRLQVPLVCDFRDPWTRNPYKLFVSRWSQRRAQELERTICARSARLIVTTRELQEQFVADYPELDGKVVTITNGFDADGPAALPERDDLREGSAAAPLARLDLSHFGSVYGKRSPLSLFLAVQRLAQRGLIGAGRLRLRFVGYWDLQDERCTAAAVWLEERGLLQREAPMPHDQCLEEMRRAHALLVLQPGSPLQVPAKIFEYVATGRPVVVIGGEGATASLVKRHSLGQCQPDDPAALEDWLLRVLTGHEPLQRLRVGDTTRFHYRALTAQLAAVLDEACRSRNRFN